MLETMTPASLLLTWAFGFTLAIACSIALVVLGRRQTGGRA
jgi:hypothetical protein